MRAAVLWCNSNVCNFDGNVIFKPGVLFLMNMYWQCCMKTLGSNSELGNILDICWKATADYSSIILL
jgi:hypothetical protein